MEVLSMHPTRRDDSQNSLMDMEIMQIMCYGFYSH